MPMPTVLIRISDPAPYTVQLFTDAAPPPNGTNWFDPANAIASGILPADCAITTNNVVLDPTSVRAKFFTGAGQQRPSQKTVQEIGNYLFTLLDSIENKWAPLRTNSWARTILDVQSAGLAALPWETMRDKSGTRLFRSPLFTLCHGDIRFAHTAAPLRGLLRVLVVLGQPLSIPPDTPPNHFQKELDGLKAVFRRVSPCIDWDILPQPTRAALFKKLDDYNPDVLHFIGHGMVVANESVLEFVPTAVGAQPWVWTADEIMNWFGRTDRPAPRLAVFSACFSGVSSADNSMSLARAVLDHPSGLGAAAAVTMLGAIDGAAAATFAAEFYKALAYQLPAEVACAQARREVINLHGLNLPDWAMPRLHTRVPPDQLFPSAWGLSPELGKRYTQDVEDSSDRVSYYTRALVHVDRQEHRRALVEEIESFARVKSRLLLITGPQDVGKTDLGICTLTCAQALGLQGVYVDLSQQGVYVDLLQVDPAEHASLDFYRLLRRIRNAGQDSDMLDKLPQEKFATFDTLCQAVGGDRAPDTYARAFLNDLHQASIAKPILLILDQLTGRNGAGVIPNEFRSVAIKYLLAPLTRGDLPNVMTLVIATDEEYTDLGLSDLRPRVRSKVAPFPPSDIRQYASDYCLYRGYFVIDPQGADLTIGAAERRVGRTSTAWFPGPIFRWIDDSFK